MIMFIKGVVESISDGAIVVEQGGIGYTASVHAGVLSRVTKGQEIKLLTYLQVRDDGLTLFGFLSQSERAIFLKLISVTGVSPKSAMSLLSSLTPEQIMLAVITDDLAMLSRARGIGKKVAGRIALELKDKMRAASDAEDIGLSPQMAMPLAAGPKQDAIDALASLGYSRGDAARAVMEIYTEGLGVEQVIKLALKRLAN